MIALCFIPKAIYRRKNKQIMAVKTIIGSFILRNEGDGCLTSKYQNGDGNCFVECCKKLSEDKNNTDPFCGEYLTTWIEQDGTNNPQKFRTEKSSLFICKNAQTYKVKWYDKSNPQIFEGTAMLVDDILVGTYWN
jgi:hypothetical protein